MAIAKTGADEAAGCVDYLLGRQSLSGGTDGQDVSSLNEYRICYRYLAAGEPCARPNGRIFDPNGTHLHSDFIVLRIRYHHRGLVTGHTTLIIPSSEGKPLLKIREINQVEFVAAGDLCVRAYEVGGHLESGSDYARTLRAVAHRAEHALVLVAEVGGQLVGTVTICAPGTEYAEICGPGELEFRFLAVEPTVWGQGIGQRLVAECERYGQGAGDSIGYLRDRNQCSRAQLLPETGI